MLSKFEGWIARSAFIARLPLCGDKLRLYIIALAMTLAVASAGVDALYDNHAVADWDWLYISALATFSCALYFIGGRRKALFDCIDRLEERGVIETTAEQAEHLEKAIDGNTDAWGRVSSLFVALVMLSVSVFVSFRWPERSWIALGVVMTSLGYIAGGYLGRLAGYGRLASALQQHKIIVRVNPWHGDGLGGMKPLADFYWSQMLFATVPMVFLLVWLWLFPSIPNLEDLPNLENQNNLRYGAWINIYRYLLLVVVLFQSLGFLLPLTSFRDPLVEEKRNWRRQVDEEFVRNAQVRREAFDQGDLVKLQTADSDLQTLNQSYRVIEGMPTWPVNRVILGRIALRNALPVVTLTKAFFQPDLKIETILTNLGLIA